MTYDPFVKTRTKEPPVQYLDGPGPRPPRPVVGGGRRTNLRGNNPLTRNQIRQRVRQRNGPNGPRGTPNFTIPDMPAPNTYGEAGPDGTRNVPRGLAYTRFLIRNVVRVNPYVRGAGIAYDIWQLTGGGAGGGGGLPTGPNSGPRVRRFIETPTHGFCGSPGAKSVSQTLPAGGTLCSLVPLQGQARPVNFPGRWGRLYFDEYVPPRTHVIVTGKQWLKAGQQGVNPPDPVTTQPVYPPDMAGGRPGDQPDRPRPFPDRPRPSGPNPQVGPYYATNGGTGRDARNWPDIPDLRPIGNGSGGEGTPHRPPNPKTQEKKAVVPPWYAKLADRAWEVTEYCDLVDAMWDCLSKDEQKAVKKTGRTSHTAVVGRGKAYHSCADKAAAVYKYRTSVTATCATKKIVCNHLTDEVVGRFLGTAGDAAIRYKMRGIGTALSHLDGYYLSRDEKAKIKEWIKKQPGLEKLIESVGCESLVGLLQ